MTRDDTGAVPTHLGGQLTGPFEALFTDAHETDANEWDMPVMLAVVTAERIGDTIVEGHDDHGHGAYSIAAGVADVVTDGLNMPGTTVADSLIGLCGALRTTPRATARHWFGIDGGPLVVGVALLAEIWAIRVPNDDPAREAEVHAWLAAHPDEHRTHPDATEVRTLLGLDIYGHLYRIRHERGAESGTSVVVPLPGLAAPGTFADMRGIDTVHDGRTFAALGLTLATLAHLTDPTEDTW